jgi:nitrogen fixation NifU-like protein
VSELLYPENILEHARNPRNVGVIDPADIDYEADYPLCCDHLRLTLRYDQNRRITALGWDGKNCAISQASASMLGEKVLGKTLDEVKHITNQDIYDMLDIPLPKNRVKCALLSLQVLTVSLYGLEEWQKHQIEDEE